MNEDNKGWHERSPTQLPILRTENDELEALRALKCDIKGRSLIILTDLDGTICDEYSFNPETNDHGLILDPDIVRDGSRASLVVATQRRANHMGLPVLWESGLIKPRVPIIAENGGVLNVRNPDQTTSHVDLAPRGTLQRLERWAQNNLPNLSDIPSGQKLVVKRGRTMLIARFQNEQGESDERDQVLLHMQLADMKTPHWMRIVNSGNSLCLQHERVNKNRAFLKLLGRLGLSRLEIFVIAIGNAENDLSILEGADLSVGVSEDIFPIVDVKMSRGVKSTGVLLSLDSNIPFAEIQPTDKRLIKLRDKVDKIDLKSKKQHVKRFKTTRKIGNLKAELDMDPVDEKREEDQREANRKFAKKHGISFFLLEQIRKLMIEEVVKEHKRISAKEEGGKK